MNILKAIFGTKAQRDVKRLRPMVERINALEVEYQKLSDDQLKASAARRARSAAMSSRGT